METTTVIKTKDPNRVKKTEMKDYLARYFKMLVERGIGLEQVVGLPLSNFDYTIIKRNLEEYEARNQTKLELENAKTEHSNNVTTEKRKQNSRYTTNYNRNINGDSIHRSAIPNKMYTMIEPITLYEALWETYYETEGNKKFEIKFHITRDKQLNVIRIYNN